jgi:hypothetical protein
VPVGLAVDGANRPDLKMVRETLESLPVERPEPTAAEPQGMCLEKGYNYAEPKAIVGEFGFTAHVPQKRGEAQAVKRRAREKAWRWVEERTPSWRNRFCGILIRWSKKPQNYIALLHFAFAIITYRCAGLSG